MNIAFENLAKIDDILNQLIQINKKITLEKKWLTVNELAKYLGYSKDRIYKFQNTTFVENLHFYKKQGKILFDRVAIDEWVVCKENTNEINQSQRQIVDNILSSVKEI
jgi:predicted DNA-binding transcriptional regulator AlpA